MTDPVEGIRSRGVGRRVRSRTTRIMAAQNAGLLGIVLATWVALAFASPFFFSSSNLLALLSQTATVAIVGVGMTFVIISGGIDLSVGSAAALTSMVIGILLTRTELGLPLACLAGLGVGATVGLVNGFIITRYALQPMVVTLGTLSIARGLTFISTSGRPIFVTDELLLKIGGGTLGGIPIPILIAFGVFVAGLVVLGYTEFGRYVYATGGNAEATRLSGIDVNKVKISVYVISGLCASLVGILLVGLLADSEPTVGVGMELDSIAVVAVGGTSLFGGVGGVVGTVLGAVLVGTIRNGMNLLNIISYYQQVVIGVIIILAVVFDRVRTRKFA